MSIINHINARQILDSRGNPTVEVDVFTNNGVFGRSSVPSGASKGEYEALELRDNDPNFFLGKSIYKVIDNINNIILPEIIGISVFDQFLIDDILISIDGTKNKSMLGANSTLGVSLAVCKAAANEINIPLYRYLGGVNSHILPIPMINIINGGKHSNTSIPFQEFMIIPINFDSFYESIRAGVEIFHYLKKLLNERKMSVSVGDEGGFAPNINSIENVLSILMESVDKSGYALGDQIMLGLDCAASEFYKNGFYDYSLFGGNSQKNLKSSEEQVDYLVNLVDKYPIISIEDGMDQNDWSGWSLLTDKIGDRVQLVGDDLFVTNIDRLNIGIKNNAANSILIKPNQIGTLTETIMTINAAKNYGYNTILSHRSGETEDNIISDLCVAFNTGQIKTGSVSRSERTSKYNQLLRIEETLKNKSKKYYFFPKDIFNNFI